MSLSLQESSLLKQVASMERDMVELKAPQRYGMNQVRSYKSNIVQGYSRIIEIRESPYGNYERRALRGYLSFRNDKPHKRVIPNILFQLYNSSGQAIRYQTSLLGDNNPSIVALQVLPSTGDGEALIVVNFQTSGPEGTTDAFYADFWVTSNDSGILRYEGDLDGTY